MNSPAGVAIVGMACRYPDADSPAKLWETVLGRRRGFRRIPEYRLSRTYLGAADDPDRTYLTRAGLLRDWRFDRERFGVPGPLHRAVDHTHWLALETAADALVDAGFTDGGGLDRDRVGVLFGNSLTGEFSRAAQLRLRWPFIRRAAAAALEGAGINGDSGARALTLLRDFVCDPFPTPGDETLAGALSNTIAGRVCNHFDFHGSGFTVDGACASSLLSVITACGALLAGDLDFALAGGVDLSLDPFELVGFARTGALAVDEMRVYDQSPTGFLPGEGCGVVALMRAEEAERAGLRTYAVLTGWGTSSDGSGGLIRPRPYGQELAMTRAYRMAGVVPDSVELVEGHGTGTKVGDEVELTALAAVRGDGAARAALGSIKANIGHTKAAAGVAGLIKATLAVHHRVLPPTTGVERPHELLARAGTPLRVLDEVEPWLTPTPLASVSSTGFGGVNAHVVLRGLPARPAGELPRRVAALSRHLPRHDIVLLDAGDSAALAALAGEFAELAPVLSSAELHDLAATRHASRRGAGAVRCALVADTPDRLHGAATAARDHLRTWDGRFLLDEGAGVVLTSGPAPRVGLLLPGQAAPVRAALGTWADGLDVPAATGVRLVDDSCDTAVAQPAIVRQSLAALAWLDACGCRPVAATGHSLGEISALVWAGAIDPAAGLRLAVVRGRVMAEHGRTGTGMVAIGVDAERATALTEGLDVEIAGFNGPAQTTVSGLVADLDQLVLRARAQDVPAIALPVSHGFHSTAMTGVVEPWRAELAAVSFSPVGRPVFSTVTGRVLTSNTDLRALFGGQMTSPVRFEEATREVARRCDLLVEAGPGTTLTDLARVIVPEVPVFSLDSGHPRRHAVATAALAASGAGDLDAWFAGRVTRPLDVGTTIELLASPCETGPAAARPPEPDVPPRASAPIEPVVADQRDAGGIAPLEVVRAHLSRTLELPPSAIRAESTLLADLHLNSLQVVQVVAAIAGVLDRKPPGPELSVVDATVADIAELLATRPPAAAREPADPPAGLADWVRAFEHRWVPAEPVGPVPEPGEWTVDAPAGHWLHSNALPGSGLAVWLEDTAPEEVARVLALVARTRPQRLLVAHSGHPAAAAIGRSAAVELGGCAVTVVDSTVDTLDPRLVVDGGYQELRVTSDGVERITTHVLRPGPDTELPLAEGDVCLVTGGADGITALCGAALARRTGCTLVLLGRSAPDTSRVTGALDAFGVPAHYVQADVTDPDDVARAVSAAGVLGPVRGLLHGAGVNTPQRMDAVTSETLRRTLAPKVTGLRLLLDAAPRLRLVVGFGSIIGRRGLPGEAEYCVANDWLRTELERAPVVPGRRYFYLEWSLWAGAGMGERMGVVDDLAAAGITPIDPDTGPDAMLRVLTDRHAPVTVLLTGRFPAGPTLAVGGHVLEPLRFTEDLPVRVPGVEAGAVASLSLGDDPYLDEHRVDGVPVLPAVLGLEAMAQAAEAAEAVADHSRRGWSFADINLHSPVVVGERGSRTVRVLALTDDGVGVRVALRDDSDGFVADRFTAAVHEAAAPPASTVPLDGFEPDDDRPHPFYGPLLFHTGRFRRLLAYDSLSAFEVRARVRAEPGERWFSDFHHQRLLLGDPGAHDAALHVLLACVPHRRALPVGADRFTVWRQPSGVLRVHAVERSHTVDDYVFDVDVVNAVGDAVARWDGLRLRAIGPVGWDEPMPVSLVGPLFSRRLIELDVAQRVELVVAAAEADGSRRDGWVTVDGPGHVLLGRADRPIGLAWGSAGLALASGADGEVIAELARKLDEPVEVAAGRIAAGRTALTRLGVGAAAPLEVNEVTDDRLAVLSGEGVAVVVARPRVAGLGEPIVAIAAGRGRHA
ncbi:SDR family NAD(P)-dependent oxidoreductase [Amycolatopsis rhizosphaerae]|uniref:SDR family NAD(P)-dependent oxidoreductase n=1 Tax=Amycolatopsis rhizosphaerae TaxID=2053003 RepID=A0A558DKD5_9PSEU|nr:type I polyketide synthase [Amycolatopsis rhizosphaerae]TVT61480.1 SDR family NAD(P)-dependent oxidoreductase [Amycolatopsis rhizosphaerae]